MKYSNGPYHSHQDARSKRHLVECSKGPSQVCGGHLLDVEGVKTHHQAAEQTKHQPSQDENLERLAGFGGEHQTGPHHWETVHDEDGVAPGGEDEGDEDEVIFSKNDENVFLPSIRICQVFDSQWAKQGSEVLDADGERPQQSQAVIWHRLVVSRSPGLVEKLFNDLNNISEREHFHH